MHDVAASSESEECLARLFPDLWSRFRSDRHDIHLISRAARALLEAQEPALAAAFLRDARARRPDAHALLAIVADALVAANDADAAVAALRELLAIAPDHPDARRQLGWLLHEDLARTPEAIPLLTQVARETRTVDDCARVAACFMTQPTTGALAACLRAALGDAVDAATLYRAAGEALIARGRYEEAGALAEHLVREMPGRAAPLALLASALTLQGLAASATRHLERAVAAEPENPEMAWRLHLNLQALGDLERARDVFLGSAAKVFRPQCRQRLWEGQPLDGASMLFYLHTGFGNAIQYVRFADHFRQRGARVTVMARYPIARLFAGVPGVDRVVTPFDDPPDIDFECPMFAAPLYLPPDEAFGSGVPYIRADPARKAQWCESIGPAGGVAVGISGAGLDEGRSPLRPMSAPKSIPLVLLSTLARQPGVTLYNLTKSSREIDAWQDAALVPIVDAVRECRTFDDLAALIEAMDVIVSADNAVGHLAGAMGKPTLMLLPHVCNWRWEVGRNDSAWYPTVRLFRQTEPAVWRTPLAEAATAFGSMSISFSPNNRSAPMARA